MAYKAPTENDWRTFQQKSFDERAAVMYLYLVKGFNMNEAADIYYNNGNPQYSQHVSLIHRCYNFSGQNGGIFSGQKLGGEVTEEDILMFVRKYPNGIEYSNHPGTGIEMKNFLKERIAKRNGSVKNKVKNFSKSNNYFYSETQNQNNSIKINEESYNYPYLQQTRENNLNNSDSHSAVNDDSVVVAAACWCFILLLVVLALVFDWFGLRSKLVVLLMNLLGYGWLIGIGIYAIMLIANKVKSTMEKGFIAKLFNFIFTAGISYGILYVVLNLLEKIK